MNPHESVLWKKPGQRTKRSFLRTTVGLRAVYNIHPWPLRSWTGSLWPLLQILICTGLCASVLCFFTGSAENHFSVIYSGCVIVQIVSRRLPGIQSLTPPMSKQQGCKKTAFNRKQVWAGQMGEREEGRIKDRFLLLCFVVMIQRTM